MDPRDVALAQLGMNDVGPVPLIEAAAAAGFRAVGLPLRSGALKPLAHEIIGREDVIREILASCKANGIGIFDTESLVLGHEPPGDGLQHTFETAARLGASRISCLGYEPARGPGTLRPGAEAERLAMICAAAAEFGLLVALEFMLFRSIRTVSEAADVVKRSGAANARIVLDALHLQRTGATPLDLAALPAALVSHLQLCDAAAAAPAPERLVEEARAGRLLPGEGVIPLQGFIDVLPADTPLSLEIPVARLAALPLGERARLGALSLASLRATGVS